jgi:autotransporter-associated beta strand protein
LHDQGFPQGRLLLDPVARIGSDLTIVQLEVLKFMAHSSLSKIFHSLQFAKRLLALFAALSFLAALDAQAQDLRTWDGGAAFNDNWTDGANWVGNPAGGVNGGDSILFAGTVELNNVNNLAVNGTNNVNNWIAFSNNAGAFVLTGTNNTANALILTNAGVLTNFSTSTQTINFGMTFTNATGTANINTASGNIILNGIIAGTNITKSGAATLFLNGTNTFTGIVTNNAGAVAISNGSSFGSNTVTFASNGTTVAALASVLVTNNYALTGNGTMDVGTNVLNNSGVISGAGSLTKAGAGTLILSAANTYSGTTTTAP